jgi:hypothetical protein
MISKTSLLGYCQILNDTLLVLSVIPYELGQAGVVIAPEHKVKLLVATIVIKAILNAVKSHFTADAPPGPKAGFVPSDVGLRPTVLFLACLGFLASCTLSPETKAKWSATGDIVGPKIASLAGQFLVNSIGAQISHTDANFLDSAAQGVRTLNVNGTGEDIGNLFRIWSKNDKDFDKLANAVEVVATKEIDKGVPPQVVAEKIAIGLNGAAASAR